MGKSPEEVLPNDIRLTVGIDRDTETLLSAGAAEDMSGSTNEVPSALILEMNASAYCKLYPRVLTGKSVEKVRPVI